VAILNEDVLCYVKRLSYEEVFNTYHQLHVEILVLCLPFLNTIVVSITSLRFS
jgi:hypothetical protein